MDPMNIILSVLAAGAVTGLQETANQAVKDTYQILRSLVISKFKGNPKNEMVLSEYEKDPETWEKPLMDILKKEKIVADQKILETAKKLEKLLATKGIESKGGQYVFTNNEGIVVGDENKVTMNFNRESPQRRKKGK